MRRRIDDVRAHRGDPQDRHDRQQRGQVKRAARGKGKAARIAAGHDQKHRGQGRQQEQNLGVGAHMAPAHQDVADDQRDRDSGEQVIVAEQVREGEDGAAQQSGGGDRGKPVRAGRIWHYMLLPHTGKPTATHRPAWSTGRRPYPFRYCLDRQPAINRDFGS
jgi:hypothetical protein